MIRIALALMVGMLLASPAEAALISQNGDTFVFSRGYGEAHGVMPDGTPWTISYWTGEEIDVLTWTPCAPCHGDDGFPTPPQALMPPTPDVPSFPQMPVTDNPMPPTIPIVGITPPPVSPVPLPPSWALMMFALVGFATMRRLKS